MKVLRFAPTQRVVHEAGIDPSPNAIEFPVDALAPEWMTAVEARKFRGLRDADERAGFAAAHWLARVCAGEMLRANPLTLTVVRRCAGCGKHDHGPAKILGTRLHVSLSHGRGHSAAIASEYPCGIDVERARGPLLPRTLSETESQWAASQLDGAQAFARLWTRKAALVKAGCGWHARPAEIDSLAPGPGVNLVEWGDADVRGAWCERLPDAQ